MSSGKFSSKSNISYNPFSILVAQVQGTTGQIFVATTTFDFVLVVPVELATRH
jgi:hypothetical protein